jgi:hypothetical protein
VRGRDLREGMGVELGREREGDTVSEKCRGIQSEGERGVHESDRGGGEIREGKSQKE